MKIGYLSIRTWDCLGSRRAPHWYGEITVKNPQAGLCSDMYRVERDLSRFEAAELNKNDDSTYRKGDLSGRFLDEESMLQATCEVAKTNGIDIVIEGESYVLSPQRVILGPEPLASELNELWKQWDCLENDLSREYKTIEKAYREKIKAWKS